MGPRVLIGSLALFWGEKTPSRIEVSFGFQVYTYHDREARFVAILQASCATLCHAWASEDL